MKFVYVFEQGVDREGGHIVGLYNNEDSALWDLAVVFNDTFDTRTRQRCTKPRWNRTYREDGPAGFKSSCNWCTVSKREIYD
jgi:hypothetical protein